MDPANSDASDLVRLIGAARELFGEHGFAVPDAAIAEAASLSLARFHALVRNRPFLVEQVVGPLFAERWLPAWTALLADRSQPLEQRLARLYLEYRGRVDRIEARLWTWAGLDGAHASGRISGTLATKLLGPVIGELRHECALPGFDQRPLCMLERELAQALHGAIAFINTRRFVFGSKVDAPLDTLVPMIVRAFLPGAREELLRIHAGTAGPAGG